MNVMAEDQSRFEKYSRAGGPKIGADESLLRYFFRCIFSRSRRRFYKVRNWATGERSLIGDEKRNPLMHRFYSHHPNSPVYTPGTFSR